MGYRNQRNHKKQRRMVITDQKQFKKSITILLVIILACVFFIFSRKSITKLYTKFASSNDFVAESSEESNYKDDSKSKENEVPEDLTFSMAVTGDIMCHNTQYADAKTR